MYSRSQLRPRIGNTAGRMEFLNTKLQSAQAEPYMVPPILQIEIEKPQISERKHWQSLKLLKVDWAGCILKGIGIEDSCKASRWMFTGLISG